MIYLFTGSNGTGKTLNAIKFICEKLDPDSDRPIFYFESPNQPLHIDEIGKLPWQRLESEEVWHWWNLPERSIVMVDEFRRVWPFRAPKDPIPESVDRLSEHRDKGMDFVLTAQKTSAQFDAALQGLIEEHRHLVGIRGMQASKHIIAQTFLSSPLQPPPLADVHTETHKYDKNYYGLYRSADSHTHVRRLPIKKMALVGLLPIAMILCIWIFVKAMKGIGSGGEVSASGVVADLQRSSFGQAVNDPQVTDLDAYIAASEPLIPGFYNTAPMYSHLNEVRSYPKPQCIVINPDTDQQICKCWSQQGTPMELPENTCLSVARYGYFDYTRADPEPNYDFLPDGNITSRTASFSAAGQRDGD